MNEAVIALYQEQGTYAVVEYLARQEDPLVAAQAYADAVRALYWKHKDLRGATALARAGIQHALTAALAVEATHAAQAGPLRSVAKGMAYDLGSFTWPGWDESGIAIDPSQEAMGLEAARANLCWARELGKGDLPLSRACWLLGAHLLAAAETEAATRCFLEGAEYAQRAAAHGEALLCRSFACLAALLSSEEAAQAEALEALQSELAGVEHGSEFIRQIETARRVFSARLAR